MRHVLLCLAVWSWAGGVRAQAPAAVSISTEGFRDYLTPSGFWISTPALGDAWRPNPLIVGGDFHPYATRGHWEWTDAGWSFESDFAWGWATFHYGRWAFDETWGWVWTPGTSWSPAWVDWRAGGGFVGWMPLPPDGLAFAPGFDPWVFVETAQLIRRDLARHVLPADRAATALRAAEPFRTGPPVADVERAAGITLPPRTVQPIAQARINPASRPKVVNDPPGRAPKAPVAVTPPVKRDPPKPQKKADHRIPGRRFTPGGVVVPAIAPPPGKSTSVVGGGTTGGVSKVPPKRGAGR